MKTSLAERTVGNGPHHLAGGFDPLAPDDPADRVVVTTERGICRVALVAARAGARFERDELAHDPMTWMLSPRRAFDGGRPIDACFDREECVRGLLVHGLGLGLDVERSAIDVLMAADEDGFDDAEDDHLYGSDGLDDRPERARQGRSARLRLYTATIADARDNVMIQAFHASMARNVREVRSRLIGRYGADLADVADIRLGLPQASPIVLALVPAAVIELIRNTELDWCAPSARTFGVDIQQCVQA